MLHQRRDAQERLARSPPPSSRGARRTFARPLLLGGELPRSRVGVPTIVGRNRCDVDSFAASSSRVPPRDVRRPGSRALRPVHPLPRTRRSCSPSPRAAITARNGTVARQSGGWGADSLRPSLGAPRRCPTRTSFIQALQEYQQRLAEPVTLNNDILIDFSSRMIAEMSMRPYKTALTIHGQTFTANEFIDWAMTQSGDPRPVRRALRRKRTPLPRRLPPRVLRHHRRPLFWTPTLKPGSSTFRLVCKKKAQVIAAVRGKQAWHRDGDGSPARRLQRDKLAERLGKGSRRERRRRPRPASRHDRERRRVRASTQGNPEAIQDGARRRHRRFRGISQVGVSLLDSRVFARFAPRTPWRRRAAAAREAARRAVHVACAPARARGGISSRDWDRTCSSPWRLPWIVAWFFRTTRR